MKGEWGERTSEKGRGNPHIRPSKARGKSGCKTKKIQKEKKEGQLRLMPLRGNKI